MMLGFPATLMNCQQVTHCHFIIQSPSPCPRQIGWKNPACIYRAQGHCVSPFPAGFLVFSKIASLFCNRNAQAPYMAHVELGKGNACRIRGLEIMTLPGKCRERMWVFKVALELRKAEVFSDGPQPRNMPCKITSRSGIRPPCQKWDIYPSFSKAFLDRSQQHARYCRCCLRTVGCGCGQPRAGHHVRQSPENHQKSAIQPPRGLPTPTPHQGCRQGGHRSLWNEGRWEGASFSWCIWHLLRL